MTDEKCWLCLRITPQQLAKAIHTLFPKEVAHDVLEEASNYVRKAYLKNRFLFCGKAPYRIIGGLLYLLGFRHHLITQKEVARKLAYLAKTEQGHAVSIRNGYRDWVKLFPSDLDIEKLWDFSLEKKKEWSKL